MSVKPSVKRIVTAVAFIVIVPTVIVVMLDHVRPGWDLELAWRLRGYVPESVQRAILAWTGPLRLSDEELREMGVILVEPPEEPAEAEEGPEAR